MGASRPEIRIGLVLYGGVSLAVYIYGVVLEVQRLLAAGAELERHLEDGGDATRLSPYARALDAAGASKVSVDIVSGTSAGGINGILLAKALARGTDVGLARELWVKKGDVGLLLQPDEESEPRALLWSEHFRSTLLEGLELLDNGAAAAAPAQDVLDLFVSATHLRGGARRFTDSLGRSIDTRRHRYVFQRRLRSTWTLDGMTLGYGRDDFEAGDNEQLAKLARATSAFPAAFEPIEIRMDDELLDPAEEAGGWFADGGILNNKPFTEALETIFSRAADRPVRRWLISIDPDPVAAPVEENAGPQPAFDRIALAAVSSIPRYQSIARDLVALQTHNERVAAAEELVLRLEAEIAADRDLPEENRRGEARRPLGPGPSAAYRTVRRQAWALEIADELLAAALDDETATADAVALDRGELHRRLRMLADEALRDGQDELSWDLSFQRRRVYYLLKLLGLPEAAVVVADADAVAVEADRLRELLWAEFELLSDTLWSSLGSGQDWDEPGRVADRLSRLDRDGLYGAMAPFAEVSRGSTGRLREALVGANVALPRPVGARGLGDDPFEVRLADVFATFPRRDAALLAAEVYGDLRRRDRVSHAQVSPVFATNTTVPSASKLAGDSLGHFGGFLDEGWRENDLMWGRLDGAETLMSAVLDGAKGGAATASLLDAAQVEILEDELPEVLRGPGHWKEMLKAHAGRGPSPADLDPLDLALTGLRAGSVLRRMLRTAALQPHDGGLLAVSRATAMRALSVGLGALHAVIYLPLKLWRRIRG